MADDIVQVNFRMPASLKAALERAAERSKRSLTAEIVARLEDSLRDDSFQTWEAALRDRYPDAYIAARIFLSAAMRDIEKEQKLTEAKEGSG